MPHCIKYPFYVYRFGKRRRPEHGHANFFGACQTLAELEHSAVVKIKIVCRAVNRRGVSDYGCAAVHCKVTAGLTVYCAETCGVVLCRTLCARNLACSDAVAEYKFLICADTNGGITSFVYRQRFAVKTEVYGAVGNVEGVR